MAKSDDKEYECARANHGNDPKDNGNNVATTDNTVDNNSENLTKEKNNALTVIFNYSKMELTDAMESLLNRGLNFAITPDKLDVTQIHVDFKRFERSVRWHEYWFEREKEEEQKASIFKLKKNNLPKNHKPPNDLTTFLGAVKSELIDPLNRKETKCNKTQITSSFWSYRTHPIRSNGIKYTDK